MELHGDRLYGDDPAIVGGIAKLDGMPVTVIGHERGKDTKDKIARNFGMPHPEGYRKALRLMQQADKFGRPSSRSSTPRVPIRGSRRNSGARAKRSPATCGRWPVFRFPSFAW